MSQFKSSGEKQTRLDWKEDDTKWITLRYYAAQHIRSGYNCVEAAMLLEMLLTDVDLYLRV
jgi:hypothetical protein